MEEKDTTLTSASVSCYSTPQFKRSKTLPEVAHLTLFWQENVTFWNTLSTRGEVGYVAGVI